jgi:hypothetical protein
VQAAGNAEPIPFNRVGDAGSIGLDRTQVVERLPSLRLAAGRLIEFAQDANRRLLERANFWWVSSAWSSALWCCALGISTIGDSQSVMCEIYNAHSIALNASSAALGPRLSRTFS